VTGNIHYDQKKKRYITTGKKKDTVVCLMGARFWRLRPEKKDTVFVLSMKGLSSTNWSPSPWFFFGLGVMNDAAESNCILPIGDDGSLNGVVPPVSSSLLKSIQKVSFSNLQIGMGLSIK